MDMRKCAAIFCFCLCFCLCIWTLLSAPARAADLRLALLVANQTGWQEDPHLRYAIEGDLRPLARTLRNLGFQLIIVKNGSSDALRRAFRQTLKRLQQRPKVSTFLMYYSGHADRHYLHLGRRGPRPLHYRELAAFLSRVHVERRMAILDACYSGSLIRYFGSLKRYKKLYHLARSKGVRRRHRINLKKLLLPDQGREVGIRIIASSLGLSWELQRYRASIFTYHLLRGLHGAADLDSDGRVSVDELFDFTSREVQRLTGQTPQQMAMIKREAPYALAPAYHSRLLIGSHVLGHIRVSVANFVWSTHKRKRGSMQLAVVNGKGTVFLKQNHHCFRQTLHFPKHGEVHLRPRWVTMPCPQFARVHKGQLLLQARHYQPPPISPTLRWQLALGGGFVYATNPFITLTSGQLQLTLRWRWIGLSVQYLGGQPEERQFDLHRLRIQLALGWPFRLQLGPFPAEIFVGLCGYGGATWQSKHDQPSILVPGFGAAGIVTFAWWWSSHFGLQLAVQGGFDYTPTLDHNGFSPELQSRLSWLVAF